MTRSASFRSSMHRRLRQSGALQLPRWISIFGWLLVVANVSGAITMFGDASGLIPGIGSTGPDEQALSMIAARQLGQALLLAFALLYRDLRVLQLVWVMVFIREAIDLWARLVSGAGIDPKLVVVTLALELGAFVHLGKLSARASGHSLGAGMPGNDGDTANSEA